MKALLNKTKSSTEFALSFVLILGIIQIIQSITGFQLGFLGILPRTQHGLIGILTAPFIHGNMAHLLANTIPFFVLTVLLFVFYNKKAYSIFIFIWLFSGFLTWCIGRSSWHIGASSVVYGLASFLFFGGIFFRKIVYILISIVVIFLYSGLLWGILPGQGNISWEGHLSGVISGFMIAYFYRKR